MPNPKMKYRVFISYSRADTARMLRIVKVLERLGMEPIWDKSLLPGAGFTELIKLYIEHAQVFLPIISATSKKRNWVQHEIGYALALGIPVVPVSLGIALPEGMIYEKQAVVLDAEAGNAGRNIRRDKFDLAFDQIFQKLRPMYECAGEITGRAAMMAQYANNVTGLGYAGLVRQKGDLTSFNIPDCEADDPIWKDRYDFQRPEFHCRQLRSERVALEEHARAKGCRLIIDTSSLEPGKHDARSRLARLNTIIGFLQGEWGEDADVQALAFGRNDHSRDSLTIVGDWFSADSVSVATGMGYRQTIFTRHAPTVLEKIKRFDDEFNRLLREQRIAPKDSLAHAIKYLTAFKRRIEKEA